jgi:hypothetical protein
MFCQKPLFSGEMMLYAPTIRGAYNRYSFLLMAATMSGLYQESKKDIVLKNEFLSRIYLFSRTSIFWFFFSLLMMRDTVSLETRA